MTGTVHNAKRATFDGRDCWIAALCDDRGKFTCRMPDISEHVTPAEASAWLRREARARGLGRLKIEVTL